MSKITLKNESAQRLKSVREYYKLTQSDFGDKIGLSWFQVRDLESGKKKLTPELAYEIERKYSVDFRWLLTGEGSIHRKLGVYGFTKEELKSLGERLKIIREKKAMTPAEMGDAMDVDEQTYLSYEAGEEEPLQRSLEILADSVGIAHEWLLSGRGEMEETDRKNNEIIETAQHNALICDVASLMMEMSEDRQKEILSLVREKAILDKLLRQQAGEEDPSEGIL